MKARLILKSFVSVDHEGALKPYSTVVQFVLKSYITNDNLAKLDVEVGNVKRGSITMEKYSHELSTKSLTLGSVYDEKNP